MEIPATFIQLHYHDRPGGVTTVMKHYAEAFKKNAGNNSRSIIICNSSSVELKGLSSVISWTECEYRKFRSSLQFDKTCERIQGKLLAVIKGAALRGPVCIVGHNLTLGKNPALSSAFSGAARSFKGNSVVSFFSVIHDFAEEGRIELMEQINRIASWGRPVWEDLYSVGSNVQFLAVSSRNVSILKKAGIDARLLLNPVIEPDKILPLTVDLKNTIETALSDIAQKDGLFFDRSKGTVFYPVRLISRKNVFEAILLCCVLWNKNLVIGKTGSSVKDKALFNKLKKLCIKYRLNVVCGIEPISLYLTQKKGVKNNSLNLMYRYCDFVVSTSIAEGFGYALYEPWLHGKCVIGRHPKGMNTVKGINLKHLYTFLPVPVSWVHMQKIISAYSRYYETYCGFIYRRKKSWFSEKMFLDNFVHNGFIDFGALDAESQIRIIRRIINDPQCFHKSVIASDKYYPGVMRQLLPMSVPTDKLSGANRIAVNRKTGSDVFNSNFCSCFFSTHGNLIKKNVILSISDSFSALKEYRLLMDS